MVELFLIALCSLGLVLFFQARADARGKRQRRDRMTRSDNSHESLRPWI